MKLRKGHILFATLVTIFGLFGFTYLKNQSVVKASNEDTASYSLEKVSEASNEVTFNLKVENPQQGSKITLAIAEETARILYAEDIEEYLSVDEASKSLAQKMDIVDGESNNQVIITFNESNESYTIPIVLKADSLNKAAAGTLRVLSEEAEVAADSFNLKYVEEVQPEAEEAPEVVAFAAPEARIASTVTDWAGFLAAFNDTNVDTINLGSDITRGSGTVPGTLSRDLTINGNGYKLDLGANTGNITLGRLTASLTINDLEITKIGTTAIFSTDTNVASVWTLNFTNVTTPTTNIAPVIDAQFTTINLMGKNELHSSYDTVTLLHVYTKDGAESLIRTNRTSGDAVWALGINDGNRGGGTISVDNATLDVYSVGTSAIRLRYGGNKFIVDNNARLTTITESSGGSMATVRFSSSGDGNEFHILNNSVFDIQHLGGNGPALRLNGNNFITNVSGASKMNIYNKGSGSTSNTANEALNLPGNNNTYTIRDKGSRVYMIADSGPSIYGGAGDSTIDAGKDTEYIARGTTSSASNGTFNMGARAAVLVDNPYYYDFANTLPAGGNIFSLSGSAGTFVAQNTDVSVWRKGSRVYIDNPVYDWTLIDFSLTGSNLATISSSSDSGLSSLFGAPNNYSRMSGNNARPVIDDLRIPTNGDKKIYGHASVPEGFESSRDAWTDEVDVDVVVKNADGSVAYTLTGSSVGAPGIEVYGEASRNGMFEIELPDGKFLETGQTVEVTGARRSGANSSAGKLHESLPEDLQTGVVTTIDVTPPSKAVSSTDLSNATKQVTGTSDEDGAKVFVKVNGQWLKDASNNLVTTTVSGGQWTIDLQAYLSEGDKVDIYLKDNTVINDDPGFTLPVTYTQEPDGVYGNINEEVDGYDSFIGYHDAINNTSTGGTDDRFDSALRLTAKDVIADQPSMAKTLKVYRNGTEITTPQVNDTATYTLTAKNNKPITYTTTWTNVVITDTIPDGLDLDVASVKINGSTPPAGAVTYAEDTRLLTVNVGDLDSQVEAVVTFDAKINRDRIGETIRNEAKASGTTPRETNDPFVPGVNPNPVYEVKEATAYVDTPGTIAGVLEITSAPAELNFGVEKNNVDTRVNQATYSEPLTVSDSRAQRDGWTLRAQLEQVLTHADDSSKTLPQALRYQRGGTEIILNGSPQVIYSNDSGASGDFVVSDDWSESGDGFKLEVPAGQVRKLGEYQAVILWTLTDAN